MVARALRFSKIVTGIFAPAIRIFTTPLIEFCDGRSLRKRFLKIINLGRLAHFNLPTGFAGALSVRGPAPIISSRS